jgi:hypothetical protein
MFNKHGIRRRVFYFLNSIERPVFLIWIQIRILGYKNSQISSLFGVEKYCEYIEVRKWQFFCSYISLMGHFIAKIFCCKRYWYKIYLKQDLDPDPVQ